MIPNDIRQKQTTKERLQKGFQLLETIRRRRFLADDPALGSGIERAILDRELAELEEDLRLNPALWPSAGLDIPPSICSDVKPLLFKHHKHAT